MPREPDIREGKPRFAGLREEPLKLPERLKATGFIERGDHAPHGRQV